MGAEKKVDEDNLEDSEADDLEIEIVDDTPEEDKGKKTAEITAETVEEDDEDLSEEKLKEYSKGVQDRIKKLTAKFHQERRAKEAAARQLEEQNAFLKKSIEERNRLSDLINRGEGFWKETNKSKVEAQLATARRDLKEAFDAGDAEKLAKAQEALARLSVELDNTSRWNPEPIRKIEMPKVEPKQVADPKAQDWQTKNTWFGEDMRMTSYALGLHQELVGSGVSPDSEEYYSNIDKEMRKVFPDKFPKPQGGGTGARPTVVGVASRSNPKGSRRTVTLTRSQVDLAAKLGISKEDYAKELLKMENANDR